jgi:hypothetical protein
MAIDTSSTLFATYCDSLALVRSALGLLATAVVPRLGIQLMEAALVIGEALVEGGALEVKQCCELATNCSKILQVRIGHGWGGISSIFVPDVHS